MDAYLNLSWQLFGTDSDRLPNLMVWEAHNYGSEFAFIQESQSTFTQWHDQGDMEIKKRSKSAADVS